MPSRANSPQADDMDPLAGPDDNTQASSSHRGISYVTASIFIIGEIAGTGLLTLPKALEDTGWIGILVVTLGCALSTFTGITLSKNWCILVDRYSEYMENNQHPYPTLGQITFGKFGRPLAVVATFSTACCAVCILVLIEQDYENSVVSAVEHTPPDFNSFFRGFGTFVYSFGGHSVFLTIQADMKVKQHFSKSLYLGYAITLLIYLPVTIFGYLVFGNRLTFNVLEIITESRLLFATKITIFVHITLAFIILLNPVCQEFEYFLNVPNRFHWKRCLLRLIIMLCIVFMAVSVPNFGSILSLIGSSTITLLSFLFPSLFYLKLAKQKGPWKQIDIPLHILVIHLEIIVVGLFAAASATYSSLEQMITSSFVSPCYT
ncbi:amino acid transporter AVT3C-like isoform X2 [Octopus sinensis]|uniref:Amino acid transporter AVT3C-like isoform X2 n=1 Tax=Octopus sinensis TaxID=2607531 RepID=A0A6P7TKF6_9MOLL|nr:amino acid transporter AVT3C-like isoform X2 [Octopus sinensis]